MHLDTVFTMVDLNKFTIHPNIMDRITVFAIQNDDAGKIRIRQEHGALEDILKKHLKLDEVERRSNTLAIARERSWCMIAIT